MKPIGFPTLSKITDVSEDEDEDESKQSMDQWLGEQWQCQACTFRNHEMLARCEMCETERGGTIGELIAMNGSTCGSDWPGLSDPELPTQQHGEAADSWRDCDVSSVASSWLDIGALDDHSDIDDVSSVASSWVDVCASDDCADSIPASLSVANVQMPEPGKAPLWSAIVGCHAGTANVPSAAVAVPPPLWHKPDMKSRTKASEKEHHGEVDLDEFEIRQMIGTKNHRMRKSWRHHKG